MECEVSAIKADFQAKVEQLQDELRQERVSRAKTQDQSVEFKLKLEVTEKEKKNMTSELNDLQDRVKKLEMQLNSNSNTTAASSESKDVSVATDGTEEAVIDAAVHVVEAEAEAMAESVAI